MKHLWCLALILCVLSMGACSLKTAEYRGPFSPANPPPAGQARVYLYRLKQPYFPQAGVYLNEVPLTILPERSYHTFTAEPGYYFVHMKPYGNAQGYKPIKLWVEFEADKEYFLELDQVGTIYGLYIRSRDEAMVELLLTQSVDGTHGIPPGMPLY